MANIMEYLDWRGDLTLAQSPFNEVDNLILSELSYLDFTHIVPSCQGAGSVTIAQAAQALLGEDSAIEMGVLVPADIPELLKKAASSLRFSQMELSHFVSYLDNEQAKQFAAVTVDTGDKAVYLAFRGTDDTLAGWKEDFLMSCIPQVPAQRMAEEYVKMVAPHFPRRKLRLGGHSKGGNLAVYGGVFCPAAIQRRILQIYSNDGPGFHQSLLTLPQHQRIAGRIFSIVPESSVVGMFMQHEEVYTVVKSNQLGLLQHDGFSWEVLGTSFVHLQEVSKESQLYDQAMEQWLAQMTLPQREAFVESLFQIMTASGARTLSDLRAGRLKSLAAMAKAVKEMDRAPREALFHAMKLLFRSNVNVVLEEIEQEIQSRMERE